LALSACKIDISRRLQSDCRNVRNSDCGKSMEGDIHGLLGWVGALALVLAGDIP